MDDPDTAVIAASLAEPAAFAAVFDRHATSIYRFLVRRVDPSDADGLLGDVFRIAFERRATFDLERSSARPWLYGIATNVLAKHRRSEARRLRATATLAARRSVDDDPGEQAAAAVDARRQWRAVVDTLEQLPPVERDTLLLYAWEDLGYAEIAAALDIPVGTVRSRLNRARRRLRDGTQEERSDG